MKAICFLVLLLSATSIFAQQAPGRSDAERTLQKADKQFFIENKGQWHPDVLYLTRMGGLDVWITKYGVNYTFYKMEKKPNAKQTEHLPSKFDDDLKDATLLGHRVLMKLQNHNANPQREGKQKQAGYYNYLIGNDPSKHASNVGLYKEAVVKNVYNGIDLRYYFDKGYLRYDFVVQPGADPSQIRFKLEGEDKEYLKNGALCYTTRFGEVQMQDLYVYQQSDKKQVPAKFTQQNGVWQFQLSAYDKTQSLIIDPLIYSTYIGGGGDDRGFSIATDGSGNAYITGYTTSTDYDLTVGVFQINNDGGQDVFVTKLKSTGAGLIYSTYIGGSGDDRANSIAIDGSGNAYVTGYTNSSDYDFTFGAFQPTYGGGNYDVFVTKLNSTGTGLIYSTYVGGSNEDVGYSIAIDGSGNAYVTGYTTSTNYDITAGAFQTAYGGGGGYGDVFVTKLDSTGTGLIYSTYIGGSNSDRGNSIAIDGSGNAYITGITASNNYDITSGVFQTTYGGGTYDVFVTKLNSTGTGLIYSTYIGGSGEELAYGIAIDGSGNAYITGASKSTDYDITPGAFQPTHGGGNYDVFVTKLNSTGTALMYSTYIGGSNDDAGFSIAIDGSGNAYVTGYAEAGYDTTTGAFQTSYGGGTYDVFVTKLNSTGTDLIYSTYIGGTSGEIAYSIAIDGSNNAYITGLTNSTNYDITPGAFQTSHGGVYDAFVSKFCFEPSQPGAISGATTVCAGSSQVYSVASVLGATSYTWTLPSGWSGTSTTNSINATVGANGGNITVTANNACGSSIVRTLAVTVNTIPSQPGAISGATSVCVGITQTYSVASVSGATSYTWTLPSGWSGTSTTNSITATVGVNGGNITVTANNACGSSTAQTLAITVDQIPSQPGAISGSTTVCAGSSQTYSVLPVSGATSYTWTLPSGWSGTSTTNSINAIVGANGGNITVTADNACGSSTAQTLAITVNQIPSQPGAISGSTTVCAGSSQTYSVLPVSGATSYTWTLPSGWSGTSTTNSINAIVGANGGNITVTADNACGSSTAQTLAITVNQIPSQPGAISGATTVCAGSSQTYSVLPVSGATSYTWTLPSGWSGTSTTNSINAIVGANGGNITVTADNACGSSTAQTLAITVNQIPSQPGAISGATTVCAGSSQTYSVLPVSGATSYTWTLPSGWSGTSTTNSITATVGVNGGNITVTADNACGSSITQTLAITVNTIPSQPGAISGATTVCAGSSQTYSVPSVSGATSYTWTLPSGWSGTSTTNSINAIVGANGGNITVTADNACGSSTAQTLAITVNQIPSQPGAISGATTVCAGSSQTYSVLPVSGATSYTWTLPSGWTGSSTTNSISATVGVNSGNITVTANNVCGSSTAQTLAVTVNTIPSQPGAISGATTVCAGSSQTYSVPSVSGATSYTWTLPSGWSGTSTTNSINATVGVNGGNITVTADNACGSSTAQTLAITVDQIPSQPGAISGATTVCAGSLQTYSVPSVFGATSYTWSLPSGWSGTSTTNSITATVGANGGNITVTANNICGSSTAQTLAVTVNPLPDVAVSDNANTLTALQSGATYQWIDCNNGNAPISGATNQSFTPVADASCCYAVIVTLNGCSSTSLCQNVIITGLDTQALSKLPFSIYPNPNRGNFTIQSTKGGVFELMDVTGKVMNTYTIAHTQQTVQENLPAGMYFVRERQSGVMQKLVVQ